MRIVLNGTPADIGGTAPTLAALLGTVPEGYAAAVNGAVVPRSEHADLPLADGDVVEVVTAVPGG